MGKLFLLLAALPFVDLYTLFRIGSAWGGGVPIALVLVSALCGAILLRNAGTRVVGAWRSALAQGKPPDDSVFSGVLLMLGCGLLIMPGPISDMLGLTLLIPGVRKWIARDVGRRIFDAISRGSFRVVAGPGPFSPAPGTSRQVIDVEAEVVDRHPPDPDDKPPQLKP